MSTAYVTVDAQIAHSRDGSDERVHTPCAVERVTPVSAPVNASSSPQIDPLYGFQLFSLRGTKMVPSVHMSVVVDEGDDDRSVTDSKSGTCKSASDACFQLGYRQHPGRGSGILEEEICLLDSSSTSGGEGGSEGSVGREYSHASSGEMGGGEEREGHRQVSMKPFESSDALLFYPDGKGMGDEEIFAKEHFRMDGRDFNRVLDGDEVLGVPQSSHYEAHTPGSEMYAHSIVQRIAVNNSRLIFFRRCFNCGIEGHAVRSCPEPHNHQLIALSRAMYQFHRDLEGRTGTAEPERIHLVEERRTLRLRWVDHFSPGEIKGDLLREALALHDGDKGENAAWLSNMLVWGYPKGWIGISDPRRVVRRRIWGASTHREDRHEFSFTVFGEGGDDECLLIKPLQKKSTSTANDEDDAGSVSSTETLRSRNSSPDPGSDGPVSRRWANYETTLFSSELLPVYSGEPLPPMEGDEVPRTIVSPPTDDTTFTGDRASLWLRLLEQNNAPPPPAKSPATTSPSTPTKRVCSNQGRRFGLECVRGWIRHTGLVFSTVLFK